MNPIETAKNNFSGNFKYVGFGKKIKIKNTFGINE